MTVRKLFLCLALFSAFLMQAEAKQPDEAKLKMLDEQQRQILKSIHIDIKIIRVYDKNLPAISDAMYKNALGFAQKLLNKKFGAAFTFADNGMQDIDEYFKSLSGDKKKSCQAEYWGNFTRLTTSKKERAKQIRYFASLYKNLRMPVDALKTIFPSKERDEIKTYEDVIEHAFIHWSDIMDTYQKTQFKGEPLLAKEQSYRNIQPCWKDLNDAVIAQTKHRPAPFVITNVPVLTDPHIIHTMTGSATIGGTASFVSTFPYGMEFDFLMPYIDEKTFTDDQYPYLFAMKLAHELGHRLFGIRDEFDKKYGSCLMYGGPRHYGKLSAKKFYENMLSQGSCTAEKVALEKIAQIFQAQSLTEKKHYNEAFAALAGIGKIKSVEDYDSPLLLLKIWNAVKLKKMDEAKKSARQLIAINEINCSGNCSYAANPIYTKMMNDFTDGEKEFLKQLNIP